MLFKSAFISPKRLTERFLFFYRKFVSFFFSVGVIAKERRKSLRFDQKVRENSGENYLKMQRRVSKRCIWDNY
jgi:hypothetical protein